METKRATTIAIDPDTDKNGVATIWDTDEITAQRLSFAEMLHYIKEQAKNAPSLVVVVEAGWVHKKSNFRSTASKHAAEKIAKNVGANHQVGKILVECLQWEGVQVVEEPPLKKCWRGSNGKITQEELFNVTGFKGRTNQEERDAVLLAFTYNNRMVWKTRTSKVQHTRH